MLDIDEFADLLPGEKLVWDIIRFDEYDTIGSGHDIQAELAPPKWTATIDMRSLYNEEAEDLAAMVRSLNGSQETFLLYNPTRSYPLNDPDGSLLIGSNWLFASGSWNNAGVWMDEIAWTATSGEHNAQINTIGSDNRSISLKGLPPSYQLVRGDKGQIVFASGDRNYFFEFSASGTANSAGITPEILIWPHIPVGVLVNAQIILIKPACKMQLKPSGFYPGQSSGNRTDGAKLSVLERI